MKNGRIAVPSEGQGGLEEMRSGHFGHCGVFTLVDLTEGKITNVETLPNQEHVQGGCMVPVNLLAGRDVNVLIVGGMGMRPLQGFNAVGIDVYYDTRFPVVKDVVDAFIRGELEQMTPANVCGGEHH